MIKKLWDLWWLKFTLVPKIISAVVVLVIVLVPVLWLKSCFSKPPKLDEQQIQKGEQAVKEANDKELANILVESDKAEAEALAPSVEAKAEVANKVAESREKWQNASRDELQAEFERRKNENR